MEQITFKSLTSLLGYCRNSNVYVAFEQQDPSDCFRLAISKSAIQRVWGEGNLSSITVVRDGSDVYLWEFHPKHDKSIPYAGTL